MSRSGDEGEHSDWTLIRDTGEEMSDAVRGMDGGRAILEGESTTERGTRESVVRGESGDVGCLPEEPVEADDRGCVDGDIAESVHSRSSDFSHLNADELSEARSEASGDSISVIPDHHDPHMDLSNFSSSFSVNYEFPTDLKVTRQRAYTHVPNRRLNVTLNLVLALSFTMVVGLGVGHFLGWSTRWEKTVATIRSLKDRELREDLTECTSRPAAPDFNELKKSLGERQRELEAAIETIARAEMKERSSMDRVSQLELENRELKSIVDEEMANDRLERDIADELQRENLELKENVARLREELASEMPDGDGYTRQSQATDEAVVGSLREQKNLLELENAELRTVVARLRYVDPVTLRERGPEEPTPTPDDPLERSETVPEGCDRRVPREDRLTSVIGSIIETVKRKFTIAEKDQSSLVEGLKAYKSVFDKMVQISNSLNGNPYVDEAEAALKDSGEKLERLGTEAMNGVSAAPEKVIHEVAEMRTKLEKLWKTEKQGERERADDGADVDREPKQREDMEKDANEKRNDEKEIPDQKNVKCEVKDKMKETTGAMGKLGRKDKTKDKSSKKDKTPENGEEVSDRKKRGSESGKKVRDASEKSSNRKENASRRKDKKDKTSRKNENKVSHKKDTTDGRKPIERMKETKDSKGKIKTDAEKDKSKRKSGEKAFKNSKHRDGIHEKPSAKPKQKGGRRSGEENIEKVRDGGKRSKKISKRAENVTEFPSGGMWQFERASHRESSRKKAREADWYFERTHDEHQEINGKWYEHRKNERDGEDDDGKKRGKDWKKGKREKASEGHRRHKKRYGDEEEDGDHPDTDRWHTRLAKRFNRYKKIIKGYWNDGKWEMPHSREKKSQQHSAYYQHFSKSL